MIRFLNSSSVTLASMFSTTDPALITRSFGKESREQKAPRKPASTDPALMRSKTAFSPSCSPNDCCSSESESVSRGALSHSLSHFWLISSSSDKSLDHGGLEVCQLACMRTLSNEAGDQLVLLDRLRDTALQITFEKHGGKVVIEMKRGSWCTRTTVSYPGRITCKQRHRPWTVLAHRQAYQCLDQSPTFDPDLVVETMHTQ
jgi:hypothetical protein